MGFRFAALILSLALSACGEQDDEAQINKAISAIEEAVEQKDFSEIEQYLHSSFKANEYMDVDEARRLLQLYSLRHKQLGVTIVGSTTTLHKQLPDRADSTVSVIVSGSSGLLPSDGSVRRVQVEWLKDADDWQIRRATWR